jgi:coproporphyrinogen III oxidase
MEVRREEMGLERDEDIVDRVNIHDISINQDVSAFLETLKNDIYQPKIFKSQDGDIGFLWQLGKFRQSGKFSLDVWFSADGTYSYCAVLADGREFFDCGVDVSQELPLEILTEIAD